MPADQENVAIVHPLEPSLEEFREAAEVCLERAAY
jgi:hypothetical protein